MPFSLHSHLTRQIEWSEKTFGPGMRTGGLVDHIRKELNEIVTKPTDLEEWIDVIILGLDGAWRCGHSPAEIIEMLEAKQLKNENRRWPDWHGRTDGQAIEHIRDGEGNGQ